MSLSGEPKRAKPPTSAKIIAAVAFPMPGTEAICGHRPSTKGAVSASIAPILASMESHSPSSWQSSASSSGNEVPMECFASSLSSWNFTSENDPIDIERSLSAVAGLIADIAAADGCVETSHRTVFEERTSLPAPLLAERNPISSGNVRSNTARIRLYSDVLSRTSLYFSLSSDFILDSAYDGSGEGEDPNVIA